MERKPEHKAQDDEQRVIELMKSTGYLFPDTDEQMAAFEANATPRELPEKFRTPEFVFAEISKTE